MNKLLLQYLTVLIPYLIIDGAWLTATMQSFYRVKLAHLVAVSPSYIPIILFYALYAAGTWLLIVVPALTHQSSWTTVLFQGIVLGAVAYGTFDLTNQAVLRDWPAIVTVVDVVWGSFMTGAVSVFSTFIIRAFFI